MSKLQLLAQKRKLHSQNDDTSNGLSNLLQKRNINSTGLNTLLSKKKQLNTAPSATTPTSSQTIGNIPTIPDIPIIPTPKSSTPSLDLSKFNSPTPPISRFLQQTPSHILPAIIFSNFPSNDTNEHLMKRRKISRNLENTNIPPNLAEKINKNFNQKPTPSPSPSSLPDKKLGSITSDLSNVQIREKTPTPTKPKNKINVQDELLNKLSKPLLSSIVIGHVDSGKSTTIGRLLYDLNIVDSRTLHKLSRDAESIGKGSFSLAWIMDQTTEERNRGVTIDIIQTQFEYNNLKFSIIDSPGHKDYLPQMINGLKQADISIVIIDSTSNLIDDFKGQTFEQLKIASNLGIKNLILLINKMDIIHWSLEKFTHIKNSLSDYLIHELGLLDTNLSFIPISGFNGDNIVKKSTQCPWYDGPTLIENLTSLNIQLNKSIKELTEISNNKFILTINDITYNSIDTSSLISKKSDQLLIHGRIQSGMIQPGESIQIFPSQELAIVDSITSTVGNVGETKDDRIIEKIGVFGDFVDLKLTKLKNPELIKIGDLITKIDGSNNTNIISTSLINCELNIFELSRPLLIGSSFVLFLNNVSYSANLESIKWVELKIENPEDGTITLKKKKRKHLSSNQRCNVIIESDDIIPIIINSSNDNNDEKLDRIVLRKEGEIVGAGFVKGNGDISK